MQSGRTSELVERCLTVDAFVGPNAKGNPAGVLLLEGALASEEMQRIANTMGLAETAFVVPKSLGMYDLRWFTPRAEVPLCGHATLASAWTIWNKMGVDSPTLAFDTLSGRLLAKRVGSSIELDFPADHATPWTPSQELLSALGIANPVASVQSDRTGKILIQVEDAETVRRLRPDFQALQRALPRCKGGIVVTARGGAGYDFESRFFHPWVGVDEDPVTGSAHCLLATHWSSILGKSEFHAFQSSARGGVLDVSLDRKGRVRLRGEARERVDRRT